MNPMLGWEICVVQQDTFYSHQDYEQVNFYKNLRLYIIGMSFRDEKVTTFLQLAQKWNILTKLDESFFFINTLTHFMMLCKKTENLEFVQGVSFEFIDSVKNNGTKYLLIFDDSCQEICNSKAFVHNGTAGGRRGWSTIYTKHNLFHQSKIGRDVELQKTHIVLFMSSRYVMQVSTLSAQLGLGSELVNWYRDATSVPYGHLLIDLLPRTDDRLRYCTNTGSIP